MSLRVDYLPSGIRYEVTGPDYGLAPHAHADRAEWHDVTCVEGQVFVWGQHPTGAWWWKLLSPGQNLTDYDPALPHAIAALGPAVWVNVWRGCAPEYVSRMTEPEKHTALNARCSVPQWVLNQLGDF